MSSSKTKIPGYTGFISGVKSENVHGGTYGKTTMSSQMGTIHKGMVQPAALRFMSTAQASYGKQHSLSVVLSFCLLLSCWDCRLDKVLPLRLAFVAANGSSNQHSADIGLARTHNQIDAQLQTLILCKDNNDLQLSVCCFVCAVCCCRVSSFAVCADGQSVCS